jgi:hypothetical protein
MIDFQSDRISPNYHNCLNHLNRIKLGWVILSVAVLMPFGANQAKGNEPITGKVEWSIGFRYSPSYDFSNFPLSIRSVPLHEDDDRLSDLEPATSPLPDTRLILHQPRGYDITVLYYPVSFASFGLVYTLHQNPHANVDSDQRYQQNQWGNAERPNDASLRWYQPSTARYSQFGLAGSCATPWKGIAGPLRFRGKGVGVLDLTGLELLVESGWDRSDEDERWESLKVGRLHEHRLQFGLEFSITNPDEIEEPAGLYLQLTFVQPFYSFRQDDESQSMLLNRGKTPHFSIGLGMVL